MTCGSLLLRVFTLAVSASVTETLAFSNVQQNGRSKFLLKANALANNTRAGSNAIFMAGIEGTMHHFWSSVHDACVVAGKCMRMPDRLAHAVWYHRSNLQSLMNAWEGVGLSPQSKRLMLIRHDMMLSYPNGDPLGPSYNFGYPRLDNYWWVAQHNNDALKIVVLLRNANESFASSHFRMGHDAKALIAGANAINNQLLRLPQDAAFMCMEAEHMPSFGRQFEQFLGMDSSGNPHFNYANAMRKIWFDSKDLFRCGTSCKIPALEAAVERTREICRTRAVGQTFQTTPTPDDAETQISNILHFTFGEL